MIFETEEDRIRESEILARYVFRSNPKYLTQIIQFDRLARVDALMIGDRGNAVSEVKTCRCRYGHYPYYVIETAKIEDGLTAAEFLACKFLLIVQWMKMDPPKDLSKNDLKGVEPDRLGAMVVTPEKPLGWTTRSINSRGRVGEPETKQVYNIPIEDFLMYDEPKQKSMRLLDDNIEATFSDRHRYR